MRSENRYEWIKWINALRSCITALAHFLFNHLFMTIRSLYTITMHNSNIYIFALTLSTHSLLLVFHFVSVYQSTSFHKQFYICITFFLYITVIFVVVAVVFVTGTFFHRVWYPIGDLLFSIEALSMHQTLIPYKFSIIHRWKDSIQKTIS